LSDAPVSYAFEQLEPSEPPPRDAAERLLAQAAAEAEQIRRRAHEQGLAAGRAEGLERGAQELAAALATLGTAAAAIESLRGETVEAVERDAIDLALGLAGKILEGTLQARPELVVEVVRGALRRIADRRRITVVVNPGDLETLRGAIEGMTAQGSGVELCDLQADERLAAGSAIVRTAEGEVDASVGTQHERAREVAATALETAERSG